MSLKLVKPGRPSDYSEHLVDVICERLANGESLRGICAEKAMPHRMTVLAWVDRHPEFAAKYARAREAQADFAHDEMLAIEERVLDGDLPPDAARVVLGSKQWRAAKLAPKKYGDKSTVESSATVTVTATKKLDISTLTDEQLDALEGALRATLAKPVKVIDHEG